MEIKKKYSIERSGFYFTKRGCDILFSLIFLFLLSPVMLIIALCIWIDDRGPILFVQERTGKNDQPFNIYKFRSMKIHTDDKTYDFNSSRGVPEDFLFKDTQGKNSQITRIGSFLRKSSLDELPQFVNTLLGTMSIIGPRPEIPAITEHYNAYQKQRLEVKPGVTGWAQVNGRSEMKNGEKMKYDIFYVENQSLKLDFQILVKTIWVVLTFKGAV